MCPLKRGHNPLTQRRIISDSTKHTAPIIKSGTTEDLYNRVLDSKVEVSIKELCGESPGIRNKLKEALTNRKVPVEGGKSGAAAVGHDQLLIMHLHTGC